MLALQETMTRNLKTIRHDATIQEAARRMKEDRVGSLLVDRGGQVVAIVTETDVVRKAVAKGADLGKEKVEGIMSSPVASIEIQRTPQDAHDMMADLGVRHLAVTDKGKIVGLLSVRDLLVYFKRVSEPKITQD
ncbi:MAG: CBS domain-containing protein [Nitrospirae bacterium]|nr:CBS domain-containing protein [Nitrospirota bacterium]